MDKTNGHLNNNIKEHAQDKRETKAIKPLPDKQFVTRESLLTLLCENPHIKTIKHVFAASLIGLFLRTVVHDLIKYGEVRVGFKVIAAGMGKFDLVCLIWMILNVLTFVVYSAFYTWGYWRTQFAPGRSKQKFLDRTCLGLLALYYVSHFRFVALLVTHLKLPIGSSAVICLEQTRLLMKTHAFVRSNATKLLNFKPHSDMKFPRVPLRHFFYFLFAPTIIYRDDYPRRDKIRWKFVLEKLIEIIGVIFYYAFLLERFIIPNHKDIGTRPYHINELIILVFDNFAIGLMFLLLGFYVVLDTTQNLFGELLRFGDRQFYVDWWTATNFTEYFRSWNRVVGDWLYIYIYKDAYEHVCPGNKTVAKLLVFVISAIVHEWVLTYMFGFLFPALFLSMAITGFVFTSFSAPKKDVINVLFWFGLAFGSGLLSSLYSMEWFVRINVPVDKPSFRDFIVPRLFSCNCIIV